MNYSVANRYRSDGMASTPPGRLLTMLYDRMLLDFDRAIDAIERREIEEAHNALIHAQEIVFELHMALDLEAWPDGGALADLYVYLTEQLAAANAEEIGRPHRELPGRGRTTRRVMARGVSPDLFGHGATSGFLRCR